MSQEINQKEYLENIKNDLTLDQVFQLLVDLGGEPQIYNNSYIISRTICHNPPGQGSFKLYYYDNTKLFRCYTECNDAFDIFQLILKVKHLAKSGITYWAKGGELKTRPWDLPDALTYILTYYGIEAENQNFSEEQLELPDDKYIAEKLRKQSIKTNKEQSVSLKIYNGAFLKNFPQPRILPWEREGITRESIISHNIRYDPINQGIVIPHYDINNQLIGIRERTLIKENEARGKYRPAIISGQMYNHPLTFNLYNINWSKDNIRNMKKAIVFEGEKSCLLFSSFFGIDNDISVAVCGSNLINYQVEILKSLGVEEIIIAFDRQYQEYRDKEYFKWEEKLINIYKKYGSFIQIQFILDTDHLLGYKDSPIDKGPEVFLELFNNRKKPR